MGEKCFAWKHGWRLKRQARREKNHKGVEKVQVQQRRKKGCKNENMEGPEEKEIVKKGDPRRGKLARREEAEWKTGDIDSRVAGGVPGVNDKRGKLAPFAVAGDPLRQGVREGRASKGSVFKF